MSEEKRIVDAHVQHEHDDYDEIIEAHEDRKGASQAIFDRAKKTLTQLYGGKRCIVCELRGENFADHDGNSVESHHFFEWSHYTQLVKAYEDEGLTEKDALQAVEIVLRCLSPFIHGMFMLSKSEILDGKLWSLWEHPDWKDKPFESLDDPRNQYFLCHAHHQQSTNNDIADGYDVFGLHHVPISMWILELALPKNVHAVRHILKTQAHHEDGLDRKVH